MENKLAVHTKLCAAKADRRFLSLLLACVLISPEPGSTESATSQVPSINMNIFGKYTCVATGGMNNETKTSTIILRDIGDGLLSWIDVLQHHLLQCLHHAVPNKR